MLSIDFALMSSKFGCFLCIELWCIYMLKFFMPYCLLHGNMLLAVHFLL